MANRWESKANRWEKKTKEPEEKSGFEEFLRVINKPGSGVRGGIKAAMEGKDILKGAGEGWDSGEIYSSDLLPEDMGPWGKGIAGFAADVVTDPLTFIPASWGAKVLKGAGAGMKGVTKAIPGGTRAADKLAKAFIPGRSFPGLRGRFSEARAAVNQATEVARKRGKRLQDIIPKKQRAAIGHSIETKAVDRSNRAARELAIINQKAENLLSRRKLIDTEEFAKRSGGLAHMPHATKSKSLKKAADESTKHALIRKLRKDIPEDVVSYKAFIELANDPSLTKRGYVKGQKLFGKTMKEGSIKEANAISMAVKGKKFFDDDAVRLIVNKEAMSKRVAIAHDMMLDIKAAPEFKDFHRALKAGEKIPKGYKVLDSPAWTGEIVHKELAREIETGMKAFGMSEQNKFLRKYDQALTWWKRWTLSPFPAYHTRNFVGDSWNNFLAGVKPGQSYKTAAKLASGKVDDVVVKGKKGVRYTGKEVERMFNDAGLDMTTFWKVEQAGDVMAPVVAERANMLKRALSPATSGKYKNPAIQFGEWAGQKRENFGRYQHLVEMLKRGKTPKEAVKSVKKYLFDYSELTPFEQRVMKRIVPFYTWTRKNVPLQIENVIKQPGKYLAIPKARENIEKNVPGGNIPREMLPKWARTAGTVRLGQDPTGKQRYMPTTGFLPASDLSDLTMRGVGEKLKSGLSPYIKAPIEMMTNQDLYFGSELDKLRKVDPSFGREGMLAGKILAKNFRPTVTLKDLLTKKRTPLQSAAKHLLGMNIKADALKDLKKYKRYEKSDKIRRLQSALRKAQRNNETRKAAKILEMIRIVKSE